MSASYYWRWWRNEQKKVRRPTAEQQDKTWIDLFANIERLIDGKYQHTTYPDLREGLPEPLPVNNGWDLMTNVRHA